MSDTITVSDTLAIEVLIEGQAVVARRWERQVTAWHVASTTRITTARELADYRGTGPVRLAVQRAWGQMRAGVSETPAPRNRSKRSGRHDIELMTTVSMGGSVAGFQRRHIDRLDGEGLLESEDGRRWSLTEAGRVELYGRPA